MTREETICTLRSLIALHTLRYDEWQAVEVAIESLKENESLAKSVNEASNLLRKKRPHGEWIWKKDEDALRTYDLLCSECGYKTFTCENYDNVEQAKKVVDDRIREGKTLFPFCPNCGASMQANDRQVTGKLDDNTTLLYSMTNGDNFIGKEGEAE